ncbi:hypothetical protein H5410_030753 [Solanum commersonii]|uniref:Uncharacterized protein n=1 Tax=Solanum commersonii TaxID=4109 RepID=A0A9J5YHV3_SOLCO|nr:hypothetical protein H5410_030753 [Solanum commersonii]
MVMIYQFKAIKENHLTYARPSYHGNHTLMQVQATQGRVLLLNPSYHEVVWPHQVKLSYKNSIMLVQATLEGKFVTSYPCYLDWGLVPHIHISHGRIPLYYSTTHHHS